MDLERTFERLLAATRKADEIGEDDYLRLKAGTPPAPGRDYLTHFDGLYRDLSESMYVHLLGRIRKGAEFIDGLAKGDPRRTAAIAKYDALVEKLEGVRRHK